jgi:hypothetical protein
LSFLQLVFGEFGLLELCRLNLFKFRIKVLKIKRKPNSPPSWAIDPYRRSWRGSWMISPFMAKHSRIAWQTWIKC